MSFDLIALGVAVRLDVEDSGLAGCLSELWADCAAGPAGANADAPGSILEVAISPLPVTVTGTGPWQVSAPALSSSFATRTAAVSAVAAAINLSAVAVTPYLAAHAGVLTRNSRTVVLPAPSGAGKTTLTAALIRAGWSYASDEALLISWEDGTLSAYPRPLALSDWSRNALRLSGGVPGAEESFFTAGDLGGSVAERISGAADVLLLSRTPGNPSLEVADRTDALAELLRRGFSNYRSPAQALARHGSFLAGSRAWTLHYDDPSEAADFVTARLGAPA